MQERYAGIRNLPNKGSSTLYASRASLLSAGTLPLEYFPLSTPDASGLQIVVPAMLIRLYHIAHMQYLDAVLSFSQNPLIHLKSYNG